MCNSSHKLHSCRRHFVIAVCNEAQAEERHAFLQHLFQSIELHGSIEKITTLLNIYFFYFLKIFINLQPNFGMPTNRPGEERERKLACNLQQLYYLPIQTWRNAREWNRSWECTMICKTDEDFQSLFPQLGPRNMNSCNTRDTEKDPPIHTCTIPCISSSSSVPWNEKRAVYKHIPCVLVGATMASKPVSHGTRTSMQMYILPMHQQSASQEGGLRGW